MSKITIKPILTILGVDTPSSILLDGGYTKIELNDTVTFDLSELVLQRTGLFGVYDTDIPLSNIIVNWGDGSSDNFTYNFSNFTTDNWLNELSVWLTDIGEHTYNQLTSPNYIITVTLNDVTNIIYQFTYTIDIGIKSINDLNLRLDIKKTVYDGNKTTLLLTSTTHPGQPFISTIN